MLEAAADGDVRTLRKRLKKNPALVRCQFAYRTPLYFAVRGNHLEAAHLLLRSAGDPLSLAVNDSLLTITKDRGYKAMQALLEEHLQSHFQISERGEEIGKAIRERNYRKVKKLLDASPELIHAGDAHGNQPIHWAVMTRQLKMIDAVVERGADINAQRFDGARPIQLTNGDYHYRGWRDVPAEIKTRPREVLEHLRRLGANCDICTASYIGDLQRVQEILGNDPGAANRPSDYITYYACSGTPLRNAAAGGHMDIVQLLLDNGADPNLPEEGIAPQGHALHCAVSNGHRAIVELLLARGARPNVPVESSADTLSAAMRNGDTAMIELLASHGAARSMELLAYSGDTVTAAAMLAANPKLADDSDALANAAGEGNEAFVKLLLRHAPTLARTVGLGGKTKAITELLFAHGMNPNHRDWLGATALHDFARRGDIVNAELFLDHGADVNAVDDDQRSTPLGWAAKFGRVEMAALLLRRGARTDLPAKPLWARPMAWAQRRGHEEIRQLLESHDLAQGGHGNE